MDTSSPKPDDAISDALDMRPIETFDVVEAKQPSSTVKTDFDYARGNMISILEKGNEALNDMLEFAQRSQHPRGFEVVAGLIKTLADTNKDLLELSKRKKDIEADQGPTTVNNNLFVGSSADLLKMLKSNGK